jgi:putative oxidoreductase
LGCTLQRLFSTFPNSWPGVGLLLLRLCLSIALVYFGIAGLFNPSATTVFAQHLISAACGIFLLAGLWTPLMGTLVALNEVWLALSRYAASRQDRWIHVFLAVLSLSAAMLGPGAWSIDARLFGRKRFDIDRFKGKRPSL